MLIGITGFIGSGKSTTAQYLQQQYNFTPMSFGDSLKQAVATIFGWDVSMLEGNTLESREWRNKVDSWWATRLNIPHLTPRWILQHFGTNVCRNCFHQDIWLASLEHKLPITSGNIVISDCRFPNELQLIRDRGGIIFRISRGPLPVWYNTAYSNLVNADEGMTRKYPDVHETEWGWIAAPFDYEIMNNHGIENLHHRIDDALAAKSIFSQIDEKITRA